ncbi:SAM-dependent methyltransferase [Micromonospora zhanjiangensis]|uniref:SAM-dependent methyltransferase n=1 Tax=Micromonospora zhanjiangensis TaxID=1522057 RepID=A0ABV8KEB1_9ACTN
MDRALYGPDGFFVSGGGPGAHFRTSVHTAAGFDAAVLRLLDRVDAALGRPARLQVVDVGAGRAELLTGLAALAPPELARRLRLTAVELAPAPDRPVDGIEWRDTLPDRVTGLLLANEWLDNVPLEVVESDGAGGWRTVLVDPTTGTETVGGPVGPLDAQWLRTWWPAGFRAEVGRTRDLAWADAVRAVDRGLAVAVDYGHRGGQRPVAGSLTGFRAGRQVPPVPDGTCDLTAHVAIDAVAAAGQAVAGLPYTLMAQRDALRALGVDGRRPPLSLASTDPAGYLRALAAASAAAELTDPAGLGGHWWLLQPVGVEPAAVMAR